MPYCTSPLPALVEAGRPLVALALALRREQRRLEALVAHPALPVAHRAQVVLALTGELAAALDALVGELASEGGR